MPRACAVQGDRPARRRAQAGGAEAGCSQPGLGKLASKRGFIRRKHAISCHPSCAHDLLVSVCTRHEWSILRRTPHSSLHTDASDDNSTVHQCFCTHQTSHINRASRMLAFTVAHRCASLNKPDTRVLRSCSHKNSLAHSLSPWPPNDSQSARRSKQVLAMQGHPVQHKHSAHNRSFNQLNAWFAWA